jgi:protein SCO1/2
LTERNYALHLLQEFGMIGALLLKKVKEAKKMKIKFPCKYVLSRKCILYISGGAFLITLLVLSLFYSMNNHSALEKNENDALVMERGETGTAKIGGAFKLVDQNGVIRTDIDFRGKYMLIYFGYSFCPDICPTALYNIAEALEMLGDKGQEIQPIFITIDPDRDTVDALSSYMQNYPQQFIALTGEDGAIKAAMDAYGVYASKVEREDSNDYLIDHSSIVYLMDRQGRFLSHFSHNTMPDKIVEILRKHF